MGDEAVVKASIPKSSWAEIQRSPPAIRDKILAVLGPSFEQELTTATAVQWVPFRIEARIADSAYEALGPLGARSFYRDKTLHSFESSWLQALVTSSLRLFGATPNAFLRMLPRAWGQLSRNCGAYEWQSYGKENRGDSIIKGFPTWAYRRKEAWIESLHGGYEAMCMPFKVQGRVSVEDVDIPAGGIRFVITW